MGISSFPGAADGVLPVLVMNTVLSVALLKNFLRFFLQIVGSDWNPLDFEENPVEFRRERRISIIKFRPSSFSGGSPAAECSVCLSGFEEEEEVSELDCSHFFHTKCLDKWFENKHRTCPLCRSVILFH